MLKINEISEEKWRQVYGMVSETMNRLCTEFESVPVEALPFVGRSAQPIVAMNLLFTTEEFAEIENVSAKILDAINNQQASDSMQTIVKTVTEALERGESLKPGLCPVCDRKYAAIGWTDEICPSCINGDPL